MGLATVVRRGVESVGLFAQDHRGITSYSQLEVVHAIPGLNRTRFAARPLGNHLHADPEAAAADRCLRAEFCDRGGYQEVALVRPPRTQLSEWLRRGGSSSS